MRGRAVSGQKHRFVAGDRSHRREHIHALGAGNARNQFHGEQSRSSIGQRRQLWTSGQRIRGPDENLPRADPSQIGAASLWVRAERAHLEHHIGARKNLIAVGSYLRAAVVIGRIGITGCGTRTRLY